MFRLLLQLLLLYAIYKLVKGMLFPERNRVSGARSGGQIREEEIEDAEYREIKD
jgi:hypothetical protein